MISGISFKGNVYLAGIAKRKATQEEVNTMKAYADKNNCDVLVLDREHSTDGVGIYEAVLVQEDDEGGNFFAEETFDFKKGISEKPPVFKYRPGFFKKF